MAKDEKAKQGIPPFVIGIIGVLATFAARKAADVVWVAVTGRDAPKVDDPEESFPLIAGFAVLAAGSVAVAQAALQHRQALRKAQTQSD